jgi:hypothetical protein
VALDALTAPIAHAVALGQVLSESAGARGEHYRSPEKKCANSGADSRPDRQSLPEAIVARVCSSVFHGSPHVIPLRHRIALNCYRNVIAA